MPIEDALFDRIVADPAARAAARAELARLRQAAIATDQTSADPWVSRSRPAFLYVMYALLLWSVPIGLLAAIRPAVAAAVTAGMGAYLRAIPEELYALFGTGYLGYTAARAWGKARGVER